MPTVCKIFDDEAAALGEVEALIARGFPGEEVRVLRGAPQRDAHAEPHGSFAAGHGDDPVGTFAGPQANPAEGSYAPGHDAHAERLGSFGDPTATRRELPLLGGERLCDHATAAWLPCWSRPVWTTTPPSGTSRRSTRESSSWSPALPAEAPASG